MRAGKAELGKGANSAKDFGGDEGFDPAGVFGAEKLEDLAAGDDDFGGFGAGEVAVNGGYYAGRLLEGETVEVHGSGGVRLRLRLRVRVLRVEGEGFVGKRVKVSEGGFLVLVEISSFPKRVCCIHVCPSFVNNSGIIKAGTCWFSHSFGCRFDCCSPAPFEKKKKRSDW